jgi:hypothetical protein
VSIGEYSGPALCTRSSWCTGMGIALAEVPENAESKGLSVSRGWLHQEKEPRLVGITYRRRARDQGMVLNFCPWCGARIRFDEVGAAK